MTSLLPRPLDSPAPLRANPNYNHSTTFKSEAFLLLQQCSDSDHLKQIHAKLIRHNLHDNQFLTSKLLHLYCSHGYLNYAGHLFDQIPSPQTFSWNHMIRAHATHGQPRRALTTYYNAMVIHGVPLDKFTFPFAIKACSACGAVEKGMEVHGLAIKSGYSRDIFFRNTLMNFYLKSGELDSGRKVFDKMLVRNVVSWTTMLTAVIDYGELDTARKLFDQMPDRNVVSWTVMIDGHVRNGRSEEAFKLFWQMQSSGVKPNDYTLVSLLRGCIDLESVRLGSMLHEYAVKNGFRLTAYLGTALIDMYSKCGNLYQAMEVFKEMESKSTATWNSMISSLGVHGFGEEALFLFDKMEEEDVKPDAITFVGLLRACIQTNDVDGGLRCFDYMTKVCGILPILDHYVCMFVLWRRAKEFQDAVPNDD